MKTSHRHLRRRHQRCVTPKSQPSAGPNGPLSSSTTGMSPSKCTHSIVDPSDPVKLQQSLQSQYKGQIQILAALVGASPLPPTHYSTNDSDIVGVFYRRQ
jgi:hypothetical protein